jgi:hypothetical protein
MVTDLPKDGRRSRHEWLPISTKEDILQDLSKCGLQEDR